MAERAGRDSARRDLPAERAPGDEAAPRRAGPGIPAWAAGGPDRTRVHEIVARATGRPLPAAVLAEMEREFDADFSGVRVHDDRPAAASAAALGAHAYTVGEEIVFDEGAYAPDSPSGRRRLAHELVHVVQQREGRVPAGRGGGPVAVSDPAEPIEHEAHARAAEVGPGNPATRSATGRPGARSPAGRPPETHTGPGRARPTGPQLVALRDAEDRPSSHPALAPGATGTDVEDLQRRLNTDGAAPLLPVNGTYDAATQNAVRQFQGRHGLAVDGVVGLRTWGILDELDRRGIAGPTDTAVTQAGPVSQTQHDDIERILHPGGVGPTGAIPPMDGQGASGAYETQMIAALDQLATDTLSAVPATAGTTMTHADSVGQAAQAASEAFFGSAITLASRRPTGNWHPGSSKQGLRDASTRPVDTGDILGWSEYFMDNGSYPPAAVNLAHHYDNSRAADRREHDRVRDLWLTTHDGRRKVTQMIQAWPAEAGTGRVFVQLRQYQGRMGMWELFGTLLHEYQHLSTHPNYFRAADAIGGEGRAILVEGMAEHMRFEVWSHVVSALAANTTLRQQVEGAYFSVASPAADYAVGGPADQAASSGVYDERAQANDIVTRVGEANARAAFFMGHVEAIGIGQGSRSETPLTGIATWRPGGNGEPGIYVVAAGGERVSDIATRTRCPTLTEEDGTALSDPSRVLPAGHRVRAAGITWHTTVPEDTRGQVANQNGITQAQLESANHLAPGLASATFTPGTLLLVPVH